MSDEMDRLSLLRRLRCAEEQLRSEQDSARATADALAVAELEIIRRSVAYQLGRLVVDAVKSPRALVALPLRLLLLAFEYWRKRTLRATTSTERDDGVLTNFRPLLEGSTREGNVSSESVGTRPISALPLDASNLRVVGICDRFTADNLAPECELTLLRPEGWLTQVLEAKPHLLFVESAWEGVAGEWRGRLDGAHTPLPKIIAKCRDMGIPSVFWNKEDPLHFEAFLSLAKMFDVVATTDAATIPRYKRELGHERVYVLPFALQPALHHPIQEPGNERVEGSFFAGAWYGGHPTRCGDFVRLADALSLAGPFEIFDRNSGSTVADQKFPDRYQENLKPAIEYADTPSLYRRFRIGLTMNTIKQSPTMFARRALELIGTGTSVYSNYSSALNSMFGDLVVSTDDGDRILCEAYAELRNPFKEAYRERRQTALRKVLLEHSWEERFRAIIRYTYGVSAPGPAREVTVLARVRNETELQRLQAMINSQKGVAVRAFVDAPQDLGLPAQLMRMPSTALKGGLVDLVGQGWVSPWHHADFYGEFYLLDLLLSLSFKQGEVVGKAAYKAVDGGHLVNVSPELEYRKVGRLVARRTLLPSSAWSGTIGDLFGSLDKLEITGTNLVSVDSLSYVENGALHAPANQMKASSGQTGWSISEIRRFTEQMPASSGAKDEKERLLAGADLVTLLRDNRATPLVSVAVKGRLLELVSKLPAAGTAVLHSRHLARAQIERDGKLEACLVAAPSPAIELRLQALDRTGAVLEETLLPAGVNVSAPAMSGTSEYRLALRVRGSLVAYIDSLLLSQARPAPILLPGQGRMLVVVNQYPSRQSLYRNAFVHRRVKAYQRCGISVDVVWVTRELTPMTYEFDGVQVRICDADSLAATLKISEHEAIAVHFLDQDMWTGLREAAATTTAIVWLHGSDIQPWHRRRFNFVTSAEKAVAVKESDARTAFWKEVMENPPEHLGFVFVSTTLAAQVREDIGVDLPDDRWTVIHNPIDTSLFQYREKDPEQRFKILLVRPHHSRIYANDVAAKVISLLSSRPEFKRMSFVLVGDGPLFESNFEGLDRYSNVQLRRTFMTQEQLAELYAEHGVFLIPTRGDTQGVTRDEAMASGLVPVTNLVGAVPEFVDDQCAIVAPPENAVAMAEGILSLLADPDRFLKMSAAAASRVRAQSRMEDVIAKELMVCGLPADKLAGEINVNAGARR